MLAPLDSLLWKHRLLVVFAPSADDPRLVRQERAIRGETRAMRERDLLKIVVLPGSSSPLGFDAAALRRHYHVRAGDFRVLLVGKDGGVKRTSAAPVTPGSIFAQIDTMPMRREEMKKAGV